MNFYATGAFEEIIRSVTEVLSVSAYVKQHETISVYAESKRTTPDQKETIDLGAFIQQGVLLEADLESDAEFDHFLELTGQRLDDGESASIAIACNRNWGVATDDRRAINILRNSHPQISVLTTPEVIHHWHLEADLEDGELQTAILAIENRANYIVGKRHPMFQWWESAKNN